MKTWSEKWNTKVIFTIKQLYMKIDHTEFYKNYINIILCLFSTVFDNQNFHAICEKNDFSPTFGLGFWGAKGVENISKYFCNRTRPKLHVVQFLWKNYTWPWRKQRPSWTKILLYPLSTPLWLALKTSPLIVTRVAHHLI